ncbi:hypothetical protein BJ742DRAFT_780575 [Cladochytrium replicatum]|nr:hypothetical protein BJ742DRAFT_780575 [Cladochytrium replicatum]
MTSTVPPARWMVQSKIQILVVVPDIEADIIEEVRLLSNRYTVLGCSSVDSPTHDDITYESIAKAFDLDRKHHEPTLARMRTIGLKQKRKLCSHLSEDTGVETYMNEPRKRMALLPANRDGVDSTGPPDGSRRTTVFHDFSKELLDLTFDTLFPSPSSSPKLLNADPQMASPGSRTRGFVRIEIKPHKAESEIAGALRSIADQYAPHGIKGIRMDDVIISVVGKDSVKVAEAAELVRGKINGVVLPPDEPKT